MKATAKMPSRRLTVVSTLAVLLALASTLLLAPAPASAAPPKFWDVCDSSAPAGQRCNSPRGVAANPDNGRLYVADQTNQRVIEFSAWGEFLRTWGWDVVASGPNDTDPVNEFEVCVPAEDDVCKAGEPGSGIGQFNRTIGVALDSAGDLYAFDVQGSPRNGRLHKYDLSGSEPAFAWVAGGGVNQGGGTPSSPGNLCTAEHLANGDVCGEASEGTDPGEFGDVTAGNYIAIDDKETATAADDDVWVGDENRIQRFDTGGVYQSEVAVPGGAFSSRVQSLALDSAANFYVTYGSGSDVHKLSPTGAELATFEIPEPDEFTDPTAGAVAIDSNDHVYVFNRQASGNGFVPLDRVYEFDPAGQVVESFGAGEFVSSTGITVNPVTEAGDLAVYVTNIGGSEGHFLRAYSPVPDISIVGPPPSVAPTITESFTAEVSGTEASLGATINPHFWEDTTYHLEYGDQGPCSANPCTQLSPTPLGAGVVDLPQEVAVELTDLDPGTTYHFRFLAQSSGGGPTEGPDRSLTTYAPSPAANTDCDNQQFRTGAGAFLPDCRAYEMVSPVDKNGVPAEAVSAFGSGAEAAHFRTTADGAKLTYNSALAFADPESSPASVQYLASRGAGEGWSSRGIDPPIHHGIDGSLGNLYQLFEAFSPDLSHGWLATVTDPPPDPAGVTGYRNLYRRDNATDEFTAFTTVTPPTSPPGSDGHLNSPGKYTPHFGGFSEDGTHTVFAANDRLLPGTSNATRAPGQPIYQLYEKHPGGLRLVSRLPDGTPSGVDSVAGGSRSFLQGAVSEDGERIYWTAGTDLSTNTINTPQGPSTITGKIYVRVGGSETVAASESVPAAGSDARARFWLASPDGSKALFSFAEGPLEGNLYRFELADPTNPELIATGVSGNQIGVGAASEDLTRVYFSSVDVLDSEPNSEGDVALTSAETAGSQHNIYLYEQGEGVRFIASPLVVTPGGQQHDLAGRWIANTVPARRSVAATDDGGELLFTAYNSLTGYDSTSQNQGLLASQVFRYDADADELTCVSCNPNGARPVAHPLWERYASVAGMFPAWRQGPFYRQRVISADGSRVWFQSFDRLLPRDTNGDRLDVYEWRAVGTDDCTLSHPRYFQRNEGCLELISSGSSSAHSEFIEATPDGSTVFLRSAERLVSSDTDDLADIYAARIGGGFPQPEAGPEACQGESCRGASPDTPVGAGAASAAFEGPGDPRGGFKRDCSAATKRAAKLSKSARALRKRARKAAAPKRAKRLRKRAAKLSRKGKAQAKRTKRCRRANRRAGR